MSDLAREYLQSKKLNQQKSLQGISGRGSRPSSSSTLEMSIISPNFIVSNQYDSGKRNFTQ